MIETLTWFGIAACLLHSAMFSGLNLALFSLGRLHLEIEEEAGNRDAAVVLGLRRDANYLLTTVLWGNVAVNTLLAMLMDSVLAGALAFVVSTFGITFVGEILPQAYFSRHALRMGAKMAPVIRFYQRVLWIVARPSGRLLDAWLGADGVHYVREDYLRAIIEKHMHAKDSDLDHREGTGALNFLALDDLAIAEEGEPVDPASVLSLPTRLDLPVLPEGPRDRDDSFVRAVSASGHKWIILANESGEPLLVLDSDAYLRDVFAAEGDVDPYRHCHRPIVTRDPEAPIGSLLRRLEVDPQSPQDDVIDRDIILLWGEQRRVITGADLLGRLLRGITRNSPAKTHADETSKKRKPATSSGDGGPQ